MDIAALRQKLRAQAGEGDKHLNPAASHKTALLPPADPIQDGHLLRALSLYQNSHAFQTALNFALVGTVLLLFSGGVSSPTHSISRLVAAVGQSLSNLLMPGIDDRTQGAGYKTGTTALFYLLAKPRIEDLGDLASKLGPNASTLQNALDRHDTDTALHALAAFDQADPIVMTARAIILLNTQTADNVPVALKLLRHAADHAVAPAFTLMGRAELQDIQRVKEGRLAASQLRTVDASGAARPIALETLREEALSWFERGAALKEPVSIRALAVAQALGWYGKPNLQAALAHLREATDLGDAPAASELGLLYAVGGGVLANPAEAERALRMAAGKGFYSADCMLAALLLRKAKSEDIEIAKEALQFAERATDPASPKEVRMAAEKTLADFYLKAAPPALRDVSRGVEHLKSAFNLGLDEAAFELAKAYDTGLGVSQNRERAYAYVIIAEAYGASDQTKGLKAELESHLSRGARQSAENLAMLLDAARQEGSVLMERPK